MLAPDHVTGAIAALSQVLLRGSERRAAEVALEHDLGVELRGDESSPVMAGFRR